MILDARAVDELVDVHELLRDIERVLLEAPKPPQRVALEMESSWLGVMPASCPGFYSVKIVGVYPSNPARGLPLVRGVLFLIDSETGEVLLEADAGPATAWRTAAASALALRLLGFKRGALGVVGAGVQGRYHVLVFKRVFDVERLLVYDIDERKAERLATEAGGSVARSARDVLEEADAIVAATTSKTPVVQGGLLKPGSLVASVGAPRPVRELDEVAVKRSRCILVDSIEGVTSESDDWIGAEKLLSLADALRGERCEWGDIRVYKSVGYSLFDLAVAIHLYKRARERGFLK
ncbi:MAG: ornithine cyclodeaminase family protein [Acidilobaceae archaeon]